jgi:hypothetical protein
MSADDEKPRPRDYAVGYGKPPRAYALVQGPLRRSGQSPARITARQSTARNHKEPHGLPAPARPFETICEQRRGVGREVLTEERVP